MTATTSRAFTLIELMIAIMIMALLIGGAALTFARPIQAARWNEAAALVRFADESSRTFARRFDRDVVLVIDPSDASLSRREGDRITWQRSLPHRVRIAQIRAADGTDTSSRRIEIAISRSGMSQSYAVRIVGAGSGQDQWLLFAGLTGEVTTTQDETLVRSILDAAGAGDSQIRRR